MHKLAFRVDDLRWSTCLTCDVALARLHEQTGASLTSNQHVVDLVGYDCNDVAVSMLVAPVRNAF